MALSDREIKSATYTENGKNKRFDGKGLFLLLKSNGGKYWRLKYRVDRKEKLLALGTYPEVSLKKARILRDEARALLSDGIDPLAHKKARASESERNNTNNFRFVATEWFNTRQIDKTKGHQKRVKRAMEQDLFPTLGKRPVNEITAPELLLTLREIEKRGALETAHRTKQIAGQIFRFAIATGRAERDPSPDLKGALKVPTKRHFAAITDPKEVGKLLVAIDQSSSTAIVKTALKLSALFFCRPGELRQLRWSDINHDEKRIEITAEKTKQPHIIPLSTHAIELLEELHPITSRSEYIFPSARGASRCMSENALRVALRSMGYENEMMTPHGFRAMARTLLDEVLGFRVEWIEQQLAHAVKDANGRAYNRTKHLKQRADMMQDWAHYLDRLKAAELAGKAISASFGGHR